MTEATTDGKSRRAVRGEAEGAAASGLPGRGGSRGARDLAVVLHDLAWLLPRTIGREAAADEQLPPTELEAMRLLVRRPGLSVNQVAAELGLQPSNVSAAVRSLLGRGLLERRRDEADGRVARLVPTALAKRNRDRREDGWGEALAARLDRLSPAEAKRLLDVEPSLRRLARLLTDAPPPPPAAEPT